MVIFPHCKINLGLNILRKRGDGYHDLETVFYPLPLKDVLEIVPAASTDQTHSSTAAPTSLNPPAAPPHFGFTSYGLPIPGDPATNLCAKAYALLKKDFPGLPPVDAHLYKQIPMGAGLGGGSADGTFMLRLLNAFGELHLNQEQLSAYALQLGSDGPFFLQDGACLAAGRGELLEPVAVDLSGYSIVLVYPGIHISTGEAFSKLRPHTPPAPLKTIIAQPVESWRSTLVNDFEAAAMRDHPPLQELKNKLYECAAVYVSMTGSGSAFYGLFRKPPAGAPSSGQPSNPLPTPNQFPGYFFRVL